MFRTLTQVPLEGERLAELPDPEPAEPELPEPDPVDPVSPVPVLPTDPVPEPVEPEPADPLPPVPAPPPVLVPEPELPPVPAPPPVLVPEPELPECPAPPLPVLPLPVPPDPVDPDEPDEPVVTAGPGADDLDPPEGAVPEGAVPEGADDPAVSGPCVLDRSPWDPTADVPDDTSCHAARRPGGVSARDGPLWPCDGMARGATRTDRPGPGVTPPTTGSWLDDRGADGRTWIDTVAIMTKMTAAAEKKNTGSVLPAG